MTNNGADMNRKQAARADYKTCGMCDAKNSLEQGLHFLRYFHLKNPWSRAFSLLSVRHIGRTETSARQRVPAYCAA